MSGSTGRFTFADVLPPDATIEEAADWMAERERLRREAAQKAREAFWDEHGKPDWPEEQGRLL